MTKAYILHSGGIDSTTCLYHAIATYGEDNVRALSIFYGQKHSKEIDAARAICAAVGVNHKVLKAPEQPPSMLTDVDQKVPDISYDEIEGISPTYVPFRNGQLLSYIAAVAMAQTERNVDGGGVIYFGAHMEDAANWAYPDCTPEFIGAMANAIYIGTYFQVRLVTPLEWLNKTEVILLGEKLGVPWDMTWSCYKGEDYHCGICPTCRSRRQGFQLASISDPTLYHGEPI